MEIIGYSKCQCGAITIYTDTLNYSCKKVLFQNTMKRGKDDGKKN